MKTKRTKVLYFLVGLILTLLIYALDYFSGYEFGLSVVYLAPVFIVSFYTGRYPGIVIAILAGISWTLSNFLAGMPYSHMFIFYWNIIGRILLLSIFAIIVHRLQKDFEREKTFARKDFLTNIANAKAFFEITTREIERLRRYKRPLTLAYMDCDNFKLINDSLGHKMGDIFLRETAKIIQEHIRTIDVVARIGGDEFVVLLPETGYEGAQETILRLKNLLLENPYKNNLPITYSIGAVTFAKPPYSVDEMIKKADDLMYQAKKQGKNMVIHEIFGGQTEY